MTSRSLLVLFVLVAVGAGYCGKSWGHAESEAAHASALADAKRTWADSVRRDVLTQDSANARAVDSVRGAGNAKVAQARAVTGAVLADAKADSLEAARVLADSLATLAELRASLTSTLTSLSLVTARLTSERAVYDSTRRADSTAYERRATTLRDGFEASARADSLAYATLKTGIAKQVRAAEKRGANKGRLQILGALGTAAVVALLK